MRSRLAKAAFALAGFLPRFHADGGCDSLEKQLRDFGGGIELSLLAAAPKGSGLGTSSILVRDRAGGARGIVRLELGSQRPLHAHAGVGTNAHDRRRLAGSGGRDFPRHQTRRDSSGLTQKPTLSWLPDHLFGHEFANHRILLYYTGVTRLAKNILSEIVRGIFLNSPSHLGLIEEIGANARVAGAAIQQCDYERLCAAIQTVGGLNQRLDAGTNPPAVAAILDSVQDSSLPPNCWARAAAVIY